MRGRCIEGGKRRFVAAVWTEDRICNFGTATLAPWQRRYLMIQAILNFPERSL